MPNVYSSFERYGFAAVWVLLLLLAPTVHAQEAVEPEGGTEPIVATDLLKLRQLGSVTVSPDGRLVVYTVQTIVPPVAEEEGVYEYRTHLFMASADGREEPRQLTYGDASASQPAWHPDGDRLAFVRNVQGRPQIFVLPLAGGEAYQLTDFEHGAHHPRWSPDGTRMLFSTSLKASDVAAQIGQSPRWPDERPGRTPGDAGTATPDPDGSLAQIRAWLDQNAAAGSPRVLTRLDLQGETDLEAELSFDHLYVLDLEAEDAEPTALTHGYYSFSDGVWMPEGDQVLFSGAVDLDEHPDRVLDRDLFVVNADGSGFRPFLDVEGYALFAPTVSPQGRMLAFMARPLDDPGYAQAELAVMDLRDRTEPTFLTLDFDRSPGAPRWSDDGWYLYFTAPSDGGFPMYRVPAYEPPPVAGADGVAADTLVADTVALDTATVDPLAADTVIADADADPVTGDADTLAVAGPGEPPAPGRAVERLSGFDSGIHSFDMGRASVFYVLTEPANPYELYAANIEFTQTRRLTEHNARWLAAKRLSVPEPHVLSRDTLAIPYWIMKPALFEEGRTYPLLVQMHGGPSAMWGPGEATMWFEFQFFASQGYGIVYSNPRGSGGYGYAFQRANYQDWGTGPAGDVLAVATEAARLPWVDPERQVLTGGSYAGYLTAWIVAHDDRFRAAVAQRGVYDLATFFGEGNAWRLVPWHFGGYPWEAEGLSPAEPEVQLLPAPEAVDTGGVAAIVLDSAVVSVEVDDIVDPDDLAAVEMADSVAVDAALDSIDAAAGADTTLAGVPAEEAQPVPADTLGEDLADEPAVEQLSVRELLVRNSPLSYVDQIETPLLIIHGDNDLRTGVTQSEMLYRSLKVLGRPVEYVRYPNASHELSRSGDPKHRMDRILRIYEFFERFLPSDARVD